MQGSVARDWNAADEDGKLDMLRHALKANCPLDMDLLDADKDELDRLAALVGLVPVYVATVDAAGLSCQTPGVVSPAMASQYRSRKVAPARNAHMDAVVAAAARREAFGFDSACAQVSAALATRPNKIVWAALGVVGMPAKEVRYTGSPEAPVPRKFLVRGEYSLDTAYVFEDGSGFDTQMAEPVLAWAIIDGF